MGRYHSSNEQAEAHFDADKHLVPAQRYMVAPLIDNQLSYINYRIPPVVPSEVNRAFDRHYNREENIWSDVISRKTRFEHYVHLEGFYIFEWLSRSPGLYFTDDGRRARDEAEHEVYSRENGIITYNPHGKYSMLQGGYGSIKLKPVTLRDGDYFLVSASSSGICHQGFPVAIPSALYVNYLDEIINKGAAYCSLIGKMHFAEGTLEKLYQGYRDVPRLYLKAEELKAITRENFPLPNLYVTPAVVFVGEYRGAWQHYVTFVTANLSKKRSLEKGIRWMEEEYVSKRHKGEIILDFDQQQSYFPNAIFSLDKVMLGKITQDDIEKANQFGTQLRKPANEYLESQRLVIAAIKQEVYMGGGSKYNISGGNQGAVGDNAQAHDFTQVSKQTPDKLDLEALSQELGRLRVAARQEATEAEHDVAIGEIAAAESAAKQGDEKSVRAHLANAGKWAVDVATKIGVALAVEAIKQSMKP